MKMTGNTFPLKGMFKLVNWNNREVREIVINKKNTIKLQAKIDCFYGNHTSVTFEYVTGIEPTNEQIEWFKDVVENGGLVIGKKIIKAIVETGIIVRIAKPEIEKEDDKRVIAVFGFDKKETTRTKLQNEINIKNDIINTSTTCNSRTGDHSTDFYVVVGYANKCEIIRNCYRYTGRGNEYENTTKYNIFGSEKDNLSKDKLELEDEEVKEIEE